MVSNTRKLAVVLVGVALSLGGAGCGGDDGPSDHGSITVTLTASGSGVGKTGNVIVYAYSADGSMPERFDDNSLVAVTLASGTPLHVPRFDDVPAGMWIVGAYLDVNGSLALDAGDVFWGYGVNVEVAVESGADRSVVLDMNTVW